MRSVEFDGAPLIAGQITGVRSFRVDKLGRLTGVSQRDVWLPGENVAKCSEVARSLVSVSHAMERAAAALSGRPSAAKRVPPALTKDAATVHRPGQVGCACGFYAYFDRGDNPHHSKGNVVGVVDGHGTVTVGSRGFRAEHARIVALVDKRVGRRLDGWALWLRSHARGPLPFLCTFGIVLMLAALCAGGALIPRWGWTSALFVAPLVAGALATYLSARAEFGFSYDDVAKLPVSFERVRANYPDVPVYRSVRAALRAHPLTPPPPPPVPSPATDADFWTRSAS